MNKYNVIGISGKFGSGKDFITHKYFSPLGFKQFSMAWHFKVWLVGKGAATHEEVFYTKPPEIRKMLQQEGTELGRNVYGENVWINTTYEWFNLIGEVWNENNFIIPDIRFKNEAEAVKNNGGKLIRIVAPTRTANAPYPEEARRHISETELDDYDGFDYFLFNDVNETEHSTTAQLDHFFSTHIPEKHPEFISKFGQNHTGP